jgi:hypothetical protein
MQEEQAVTFEPVFDAGYIPWFAKLFALYLLFVLLLSAVRAARIIWVLWKHRKTSEPLSDASSKGFWELCQARAAGFRKLSYLSLLLNGAVLTWSAADLLANLQTSKTPSLVWAAITMSDPLRLFTMGLFVCAGLYLCSIVFEAAILRQRLRLERDEPSLRISQAG